MTDWPTCEPGCITCGDVALPLRVVEVDPERELALCQDDEGRRETVEIALVDPVEVGDGVLVHAGTAISRLAPAEVQERLEAEQGLPIAGLEAPRRSTLGPGQEGAIA